MAGTYTKIRDAVADGLARGVARHSEMVTRWYAVVEVIEPSGKRAAYLFTPDGAMPWDSLGLLDYAIAVEKANFAAFDDDDA